MRAVVADDSRFMRALVRKVLESAGVRVVAEASNGKEAVELTLKHRPDVVIMDVVMPRMDGITAIRRIMKASPTPIIVFSSITPEGSRTAIEALEAGALDVLPKPGGLPVVKDLGEVGRELLKKVKVLGRVGRLRLMVMSVRRRTAASVGVAVRKPVVSASQVPRIAVAVASSTGGPPALVEVFSRVEPRELTTFFIVQHMPPYFTKSLAARLDSVSKLRIKEAEQGEEALPEHGYVAPGDYHMLVRMRRGKVVIELNKGPKVHSVRPAADVTMKSVAEVFGANTVGVVLTGISEDGTEGAAEIKRREGMVIAQDEATSAVWGMPGAVVKRGLADYVLPIHEIGPMINKLVFKILRRVRT